MLPLCFQQLCTIAFPFIPLAVHCCFVIILPSLNPPTHQNLLPIATPHHAPSANLEQASLCLSLPSTEDAQHCNKNVTKIPIVHHVQLICTASFKEIITAYLDNEIPLQKPEIYGTFDTKFLIQMPFGLIMLNKS